MKIAVISDLHLGFRQYGSIEREEDFYKQFKKVCQEINQKNPTIVIIAGDIFNKPNPTPSAINNYREGIQSLAASMICVIKGNHTMILRDNHYAIDEFFGKDMFEGYTYLDDETILLKNFDKKQSIIIDGITYRSNSNIDEFLSVQKKIASKENPIDDCYRILVIHQSFKEFCGFTGEELSIEDIDYSPYDVVICGHIHSRFNTVLSDGTKFIQPGSIERMNTAEALDEQRNGKGFYIIDTKENSVKFYRVKCFREFLLGDIKLNKKEDLENHLKELNNIIEKSDYAPIISYTYKNNIENIGEVRDKIGLIKENVLLNKSSIDDETQEDIVLEFTDDEMPTVLEAIRMYGKESGLNEKQIKLAIDLYEELNKEDKDVMGLLDSYYKKNVQNNVFDNKNDKELEKLIEYFED